MSDTTKLIDLYHKEKNPIKKGAILIGLGVISVLAITPVVIVGLVAWFIWAASTGNLPAT